MDINVTVRHEHHHHYTHREITHMSEQLDNLATDFASLKEAVNNLITAIPTLVANGIAAAEAGDNTALAAMDAAVRDEVAAVRKVLDPTSGTTTNDGGSSTGDASTGTTDGGAAAVSDPSATGG